MQLRAASVSCIEDDYLGSQVPEQGRHVVVETGLAPLAVATMEESLSITTAYKGK